MNVQEYIESGILEAYVLDALGPEEKVQVAANIAQYPELAEEVTAIEESMQAFAEAHAVTPPPQLQDKIWDALQQKANPAPKPVAQTIPLPKPDAPGIQWQRAAVWILLVGSVLVNLMLMYQRNDSKQQSVAMQQQMDSLQQQQKQLAAVMSYYTKEKDMTADPGMQTIIMHTLKQDHPMAATIYWSKAKGEAYLAVEKLPMPPKGMQYQMWVIQKGAPVSMGVIDNALVQATGMQKLPMQVNDGEAFAISLEKEGGSPTPTAENIYVLGKVAG